MKLSYNGFVGKWHDRFLPNTVFKIEEADFQEFALDIADTFGVSMANVPEYVPGTTYVVGYLVRYTPANAQEAFYYALNAGKLTAPGSGNTTDWKVVPGPVLPTELSQSITLLQAQGLDQTSVKAGRLYLIDFGPDAQGATQTIAVRGVGNDFFDVQGTLEVNGVRTAVTAIDVQAGTWQVAGVDAYTKTQTDGLLATVATTQQLATTRTANYTLALSDAGCLIPVTSANPVTVTVPDHASVAFAVGTALSVLQYGVGKVSITAASGVVVQTGDGLNVLGQYYEVFLLKLDLNTWLLKGGVQ